LEGWRSLKKIFNHVIFIIKKLHQLEWYVVCMICWVQPWKIIQFTKKSILNITFIILNKEVNIFIIIRVENEERVDKVAFIP